MSRRTPRKERELALQKRRRELALSLQRRDLERAGYRVEMELRFAPPRRWRFDMALPDERIAVEIEGAIWTQGRHTRGSGFRKDMEKYNRAAVLGWRLLRFTWGDVLRGAVTTTVLEAIETAREREEN